MKTLYLSREGLTELPPELGQLTQLQRLDLAGNQLTDSPYAKELRRRWSGGFSRPAVGVLQVSRVGGACRRPAKASTPPAF